MDGAAPGEVQKIRGVGALWPNLTNRSDGRLQGEGGGQYQGKKTND